MSMVMTLPKSVVINRNIELVFKFAKAILDYKGFFGGPFRI